MPHPKGGYKLADNTRVPGVTTICGRFKDSGALLWWAFGQGKAAERGEISSLYDKRDEAADAGTLAHSFVERHINGDFEFLRETIVTRVQQLAFQGYRNYCEWAENNRIGIVAQEMEMVSEKYRFGGCPDGIGVDVKGLRSIVDWKTSSSGPYVDWLLQLAAYDILWTENHPDQPITGGYHLCRFSKENADFHHHYWSELELAKEQFLSFLESYQRDKLLKKRL